MKKILLLGLFMLNLTFAFGKTAEEYIESARAMENEDIFDAIEIMEEAVDEYPDNVDVLSVYGLMVSKGSGQTNFLKAGSMVRKAEKIFAQALEMQENHKNSLLWRGILRVNVPKFFNKLAKGISDLESVARRPGLSNDDYLVTSYYLALGYQKQGNEEKAIDFYKNIIRYGSNSPFYQDSLKQVEDLTSKTGKEVLSDDDMQAQVDEYLDQNNYLEAYKILSKATEQDTTNIDLYLKYLNVIQVISQHGYDEKIYEDVAFMTDLAFNVADALSRIVQLMPENENFRLLKADVLSQLPFFVKSLEDARLEAEWVLENSKNKMNIQTAKDIKERIINRQARKELTDSFLASEDEKEKAKLISQMQFQETKRDKPQGMATKISLTLGFGDYIAPQTAVWIEDLQGNYIASVYVSGFSANIKDKQVHLPKWAKKSEFESSIVQITGASIDSGKHTFYWDNKDKTGNVLTSGDYWVYAEVSHWPHANYSLQKVKVSLGGKSYSQTSQGDLIITELKAEY